MDVLSKYDVIETLREGSVQSFRAREKATGRDVLVHLTDVSNRTIADAVRLLATEKRAHILEKVEESGRLILVTDTVVGGNLEEWLGSGDRFARTGKWSVTQVGLKTPSPVKAEPGEFTKMFQSPAPGQSPPATPSEPGEFTRMFQAPTEAPSAAAPPPKLPPSERPTEVLEPPPKPPMPGEFTRMFQPPSGEKPPATPAPSISPVSEPPKGWVLTKVYGKSEAAPQAGPVAEPASAPPAEAPGEFTRMFQAPASKGPAANPPAPPSPTPGGFTAMFQPPATPASPQPPPPAPAGPGEFTRMFNAPTPPSGGGLVSGNAPSGEFNQMLHGRPSGEGSAGGDFTRMFGRSQAPGPAPAQPAPPRQGPGEFTRMFESPAAPPPPTPPVTPPAAGQFQAPQFQPPQVQAPQFQGPQVQGPQFQAPQFQPPQFQPPAPPQPAATPRPTNYLPLVLILAGLLVVAIVLVVYFARR